MKSFGPYPAMVTDIHDGDTISLIIDLGFGIQATEFRCRFFGIDAPELKTELGKEALAFLKTLIQVGSHVTVLSHDWDKYGGRFDGEVWRSDLDTTQVTLNRLMVEGGHAVWKTYGASPSS